MKPVPALSRHLRSAVLALAAALPMALPPAAAHAGEVADRVDEAGSMNVCIWPGYYGISLRNPRTQRLEGLDIELAAELARDLKLQLRFIESSFPSFIDDLDAGRCDVAMFAIGMLPQRMARVSFTRPYLQSDIYGVTTRGNRVVARWEDIDQPGVAVAVQAGTFMEPVMRAALKQAQLVRVEPPNSRERELEAGRVDVFMTDYPYSRRLLDNADWALLVAPPKPFFVLPYAYAVKQGNPDWLDRVDRFVERIQRDGRLLATAQRHRLADIVRLN